MHRQTDKCTVDLSLQICYGKLFWYVFFDCEIYLACPSSDIVGGIKFASVHYVEYLSFCGIFVIMWNICHYVEFLSSS